jgi:diamine N-acetyltransferase
MKPLVPSFGKGSVQLRLLQEPDLDLTLQWRNREDARVWFKTSDVISSERHRSWFQQYSDRDDDFVFVVESRGVAVGQVSVYSINRAERSAEVGRFLAAPEAQGFGLLNLACAELLRFCAETLKLNQVYLEVKQRNERAIRLYKRNGFCEEQVREGMIKMIRQL